MVVDKQKIEKEAREILDKFAKALEKVEKEHEIDSWVDRDKFEREESSESEDSEASRKAGSLCLDNEEKAAGADANFKKKILANAPNHDEDFIIGERGGWKWMKN